MNLGTYVNEIRAELKHVSWPTRSQAINFTILVIVISVAAGLYLGAFDVFFTWLLSKLLS